MDDLIRKNVLIKNFRVRSNELLSLYGEYDDYARGFDEAFDKVIDAPTVDAVPVVRCKDCVAYRNHPYGLCYAWTEPADNEMGYKGDVHCVEPDDYCSFGERLNVVRKE